MIDMLDDTVNTVKIPRRNALANGAIHHPISAPKNQEIFEKVFISSGLLNASKLIFVKKSNFERAIRALLMEKGVRIKRILFPKSKRW